MRRIAVGDIMTRNFVSLKPGSTLHECAKAMAKERVNSVLVTENKRLLGIVTSRDILWAITKRPGIDLKKISVSQIATKKLAVIKPSADISQALRKMQMVNFRRLPVLSKDKVIGVVTLKDILAIEPSLYEETRSLLDDVREERNKINNADSEWPLEGMCENCGAFSELLKVEGTLLCADCREEMY
ncbi:CBS domain-containing protein [Candidatus Pacearchaeota archaeon]|nr:CBS domain-containing protein [Candidatus Pacearchaeota archaeon]